MALNPKGENVTLFELERDNQMFWFLIDELGVWASAKYIEGRPEYGSWCTNIVNDKDWW